MKFGICNEIFQGWKIDDAIAFAAKTGYDAIEIAPFTLAPYVTEIPASERHRIRDLAKQHNIAISGIHWVLVQAEGMYLNSPDPVIQQKTSRYFCDLVDFCADLGGRYIIVGSPKQRNVLPELNFEQAWNLATETFRASVRKAEERKVILCFEPLGPGETNFVNTAQEGIRFARQFNSPAMKVILDVKAMSTESKPIPQIIAESAGEFAYFHANDANLKGPGFGDIDFAPIFKALRSVGYDGYMSVEVFKFEEGPEAIATRSLDYLKRIDAQTAGARS